jgi:hypothetical protein
MTIIIAILLSWLTSLPAHTPLSVVITHPPGSIVRSPADEFCDRGEHITVCTMTPGELMRTQVKLTDNGPIGVRACLPSDDCREVLSIWQTSIMLPMISRSKS